MDAALNGLAHTTKHSGIKEAVVQAKEALKNGREKGDVPIPYIREKCLAAIELSFDHGSEKTAHYAVEGVQALLRDQQFHSISIEHPQHNLPTQVLHSLTGIAQWNSQLQCHCLTLLVEMICSSELMISLLEVEESLELCMRVFGASREESVRVSARAAVSQSIASYFSNRYAAGDETQDQIAVYLDVTKLLESYCGKLEQMTTSNEQSVVLFDATNALLTAQPLSIHNHTPFVNLLWKKLCPLMIGLLGVPLKNVPSPVPSTEEPMGQGQMAKFTLSPAVIAHPEATRALYQILEQLIRIMAGIPSVHSVLESVFHKAFLFPKIEQRFEAIKVIRKIVSDKRRICDLLSSAVRSRSLSLLTMIITCLTESSNPQFEISIEAVRATGALLQGVLDFCHSTNLLENDVKKIINEMFSSMEEASAATFSKRSASSSTSIANSDEKKETIEEDIDNDDEMSLTLKKLTAKFAAERMSEDGEMEGKRPQMITERRSTEYDESSEKVTAKKLVDSLCEKVIEWSAIKSTLSVDEAILQFASTFYSDFSAVHNEAFKSKLKIQQEFLNTDAIYLTTYAVLSLAHRGKNRVPWNKFKESVLNSGCIVYVSESWLEKVYSHVNESDLSSSFKKGTLIDVIRDYDGFDRKILSDVERLQKISQGPQKIQPYEERLVSRWFLTSAWDNIVTILSTFLGIKERRKARQKVLEGVEYSINAIQILATVALHLELGERCGWIFDSLVESSCDVEELRNTATAEEQKRWSAIARDDLLSIQLVLDNAFVSIYAPECWKHVIRCTEYVWELEKFIYGSLCYEKTSRFSFGWKKQDDKTDVPVEEGIPAAERTVQRALGDKALDKDNINKALCVLIAKVDRFYSTSGRHLCLRALRELSVALVSASENRIFYSGQKAPALTPAVNLLARISELLTPLPNRPLVHQMLIWPIVARHFSLVSSSPDESRCGVSSLSESAGSLLLSESAGLCFNQMLLAPFQSIVCSDWCSPETREQLVSSLSDFVRSKSDKLGSGWKPLFGTLRAVRTAEVGDATVHWTVLDVIGTYLGINKCSVLSWSLPDCLPCVVHFLQSSASSLQSADISSESADDQLSSAALRLIQPIYSVILNLYRTPHIPNHNLLHRSELRSRCVDEIETSSDTSLPSLSTLIDPSLFPQREGDPSPIECDASLEVPLGPFPWRDCSSHETASMELLLSFVEQLTGSLVRAPPLVQPPLLSAIHLLLNNIKDSEFGVDMAAYCISTLLLPQAQKWLRRGGDTDNERNMKQAIGTCTQTVVEFLSVGEQGEWHTRLLSDICLLLVECCGQKGDLSRVGTASLRHVATSINNLTQSQWRIIAKAIWDAISTTLQPLRLLSSYFLADSEEEGGDLGEVLVDGPYGLPIKERMLAEQVFLVDSQREANSCATAADDNSEEPTTICDLMLIRDGAKQRLPLSLLISSLLAHHTLIQLIGSLLCPSDSPPPSLRRVLSSSSSSSIVPFIIRSSLMYCLDASFYVAREFDNRHGLRALLSKCTHMNHPNLFKQMVSCGLIKTYSLYLHRNNQDEHSLKHLERCLQRLVDELKRIEVTTSNKRMIIARREHQQQQFEFMLVEQDGEKLYRLVSNDQINSTLAEYHKQRPMGIPSKISERKNPFTSTVTNISNSINEMDIDSLRLLAYRDICIAPVNLILQDSEQSSLLPIVLPAIEQLILASPDLTIRNLAVNIIHVLYEKQS